MSDAIHIRKEGDWKTLCGKPLAEQEVSKDTPSIYGPVIGWEGNATCLDCMKEVASIHSRAVMRAVALRNVAGRRLRLLREVDTL